MYFLLDPNSPDARAVSARVASKTNTTDGEYVRRLLTPVANGGLERRNGAGQARCRTTQRRWPSAVSNDATALAKRGVEQRNGGRRSAVGIRRRGYADEPLRLKGSVGR
jgi:hypothetical protein